MSSGAWKCVIGWLMLGASASAGDRTEVHPRISEVLFNVPGGITGDADKDGSRHASGDEFIEIANPSNAPISLKGYVLYNRRASFAGGTGSGVRFVFPDCVLPAHGVAVVFNGCESERRPEAGSEEECPAGESAVFPGALVFSMGVKSKGTALANAGDWIALAAPDGSLVEVVWWGAPDPPVPPGVPLTQEVDSNPKGSVQRLEPGEELENHRDIDSQPFSPGVIPRRTSPRKEPARRR